MKRAPRSPSDPARALVLGAGGWGTAISNLLAKRGFEVILVPHRNPGRVQELLRWGENRRYLPGVKIHPKVRVSATLEPWLNRSSWLFLAVPMKGLRESLNVLATKKPSGIAMISLVKGLDPKTLQRPSEMIREVLRTPLGRIAVLSGPSHAEEVGSGVATAVVVASRSAALAAGIQARLSGGAFRVYSSPDVTGVELAGALKNVIALAAGMADGLGLGDNAKAALLTRGLAELTRVGTALGAKRETFFGLAGMGDLVVTCTSAHGRNLRVGRALGRGRKLGAVLKELGMVAEGVGTARPALKLARGAGVETPIIRAVDAVLGGFWSPREALRQLMDRPPASEWR